VLGSKQKNEDDGFFAKCNFWTSKKLQLEGGRRVFISLILLQLCSLPLPKQKWASNEDTMSVKAGEGVVLAQFRKHR